MASRKAVGSVDTRRSEPEVYGLPGAPRHANLHLTKGLQTDSVRWRLFDDDFVFFLLAGFRMVTKPVPDSSRRGMSCAVEVTRHASTEPQRQAQRKGYLAAGCGGGPRHPGLEPDAKPARTSLIRR
jgi:hypothetical protein